MTIDDQIKYEKLQYDINREAAKISALLPGKINKCEYLTGEKILPSNQKQIIEQAKFTYCSLGKAFKKQTKTIQDQGKKQVDILKTLNAKKLETVKDNKCDYIEELLKYKEIFDDLSKERIGEICNASKQIDFNNLTYKFKDENLDPIHFIDFKGPLHIYNNMKNGNTSITKKEEDEKQFKSHLGAIATGNTNYRSKDQLDAIKNIKNLYNLREKVIKFFNDYAKIRSESTQKTKQERALKTLTPKQILQRLPIALAEVKAVNNPENLLNEIRQIVYSLCQLKAITKKVYNNITHRATICSWNIGGTFP